MTDKHTVPQWIHDWIDDRYGKDNYVNSQAFYDFFKYCKKETLKNKLNKKDDIIDTNPLNLQETEDIPGGDGYGTSE